MAIPALDYNSAYFNAARVDGIGRTFEAKRVAAANSDDRTNIPNYHAPATADWYNAGELLHDDVRAARLDFLA